LMVVMAFKIAGSRAARQPHVIYHYEEGGGAMARPDDAGSGAEGTASVPRNGTSCL
jgi:hypothetical protein